MIPPPVGQERMQKQCQTLAVSDTAGYGKRALVSFKKKGSAPTGQIKQVVG